MKVILELNQQREIVERIKEVHRSEKAFKGTNTTEIAREVLRRTLDGAEGILDSIPKECPEVICLVGVNGSGKTTTCAKLGHRFKEIGSSSLLAACDTFRAAATEQLQNWADRLDLQIVTDIMVLTQPQLLSMLIQLASPEKSID